MKSRRIRLDHQAVPAGYEPGYPAELSPEEYRDLILAHTHARAARLALAAGALASCGADAEEGAGATQTPAARTHPALHADPEPQVLALVRREHARTGSSWYPDTSFRAGDESGRDVVLPSIPISFGNSMNGVFDAARARELGRELFAIFGLAPQADVRVDVGDGAVLDGYDAARRIGFELRGREPEQRGMLARAGAEPPLDGLSDEERSELERQGLRVHVADLGSFPLMDGDQFTPTLAWMAGLVAFLNEVTDGPQIDLSAVLLQDAQRFPLPAPEELALPSGVTAGTRYGALELRVERSAPLRLDLGGAGGQVLRGRAPRHREKPPETPAPPASTAGAPTVLLLEHYWDAEGHEPPPGGVALHMRLWQDGLELESPRPTLFAPRTFDASRPFTLELSLAPGAHVFQGPHLLVGVPAR